METINEPIQENAMFDMRKTGAVISQLRREAGLTQADLAEKLGISYQAVSSWERGASMPDIGKLVDLARTLNTTVDHILTGIKPDAPQPAQQPEFETGTPAPGEAAPLEAGTAPETREKKKDDFVHIEINGEKIARAIKRPWKKTQTQKSPKRTSGLASLFALAPFLDQETLDSTALNTDEPIDLGMLVGLAPFLSAEALDTLAERCDVISDVEMIGAIAPFLSKETVSRLFARCQAAARAEKEHPAEPAAS